MLFDKEIMGPEVKASDAGIKNAKKDEKAACKLGIPVQYANSEFGGVEIYPKREDGASVGIPLEKITEKHMTGIAFAGVVMYDARGNSPKIRIHKGKVICYGACLDGKVGCECLEHSYTLEG